MKRILLFLLAAMLATVSWAKTFTYEGLTFVVTSEVDHTVGVYRYQDVTGDITIPYYALNNTSRYIVTSIEYNAFWFCSGLTSVTIPNSVTSIGSEAFSGCSGLTSVTIPNSVTSIGSEAFSGCSGLTSVVIPNSVTEIGSYAFSGCSRLTSVTIPNSVTSIGEYAFFGCSGLTEIVVEKDNPNYASENGVLFNVDKTELIVCPGGKTGEYTIPNSVTEIESQAFFGCSSLTSVTIPTSVTSIGMSAFYGCSGLMSVVIPNSVTSIGDYAFYGCSSLTSVTIPNSVTSIGSYAFQGCSGLTSVVIPNSVTSIGWLAFEDCSSLTSVTIPNSVTYIGNYAFRYCSGLTEIVVENGNLNYLSENGVLFNVDKTELIVCPGGKTGEYTIPNSVTEIEEYAFSGCSGLTSVTIPNSVTEIGGYAFYGCSSLKRIYDLNPTPQSLGRVFDGVPDDAVVYIPKGSFRDYFVATGWAKFTDFREIGVFDMALSDTDLELSIGSTATVAATVTKDDEVTVTSEEWSSSNPEVATVDNGVITAVAAGEAVIYFTVVDGYGVRHTESCAVTVSDSSGVESVLTDTADFIDYTLPVKVYNLQGVLVADSMDSLPAGLYIVSQGKNVKKVAVR